MKTSRKDKWERKKESEKKFKEEAQEIQRKW